MGVFRVFSIVQMVPNRTKRHLELLNTQLSVLFFLNCIHFKFFDFITR